MATDKVLNTPTTASLKTHNRLFLLQHDPIFSQPTKYLAIIPFLDIKAIDLDQIYFKYGCITCLQVNTVYHALQYVYSIT